MTNLLAINFNHDGAGVILSGGRIAAFATTERLSRKRKHPGVRECELHALLRQARMSLGDIDHVILCNLHTMDSPDIVRTYGTDLKETWLPFTIDDQRETVTIGGRRIACTVNPDHHLLHCATAYYTSPFASATIFSADPGGSAAYVGRGSRLVKIEPPDLKFTANMAYTLVSLAMFGTGIFGAGKVMGLAPYGERAGHGIDYREVQSMRQLYQMSRDNPLHIMEAGRRLNAGMAYHVQRCLEVQLIDALDVLHTAGQGAGAGDHLCLSGGTALNSVANQTAFGQSRFSRLHLHPACGDDGTAIGAALWFWHDRLGHPKQPFTNAELMYSVQSYDGEIDRALAGWRDEVIAEERDDYREAAAELLADGAVIGWFQGAGEIGPRALGNRSILADPRRPDMKDRLNGQIKRREAFRPFAPAVLSEFAQEWFGLADSPFMLRVSGVLRDGIPAVTHVDGSARIQTVAREDNPAFHALLSAFHARTGVPLVLNTSFNIGGEPIVETPDDAIRSFLGTSLDYLVFPRRLVRKRTH